MDDEQLAQAALDAAALTIQEALGQTDGGPASHFFDGMRGDAIRDVLLHYIRFERLYADPPSHLAS